MSQLRKRNGKKDGAARSAQGSAVLGVFPTSNLSWHPTDLKPKFIEAFGPLRAPGETLTDHHRDVARALQTVTEDVVLHVARHLAANYPSRNLVLTGGVALNCVANARILRDTEFHRVWVPPCATDTGAPLGSALWHHHQTLGKPRGFEMTHAFYGSAYSPEQMRSALVRAGLEFKELNEAELLRRVARDLGSFYTRDRPTAAVARARDAFTVLKVNSYGGE